MSIFHFFSGKLDNVPDKQVRGHPCPKGKLEFKFLSSPVVLPSMAITKVIYQHSLFKK